MNTEKIEFLQSQFPNLVVDKNRLKSFTELKNEYDILLHGVGLRILPSSIIKMIGKDTVDFIHRISTNDLKKIADNKKTTTLFTNEKGRIIDRTTFIKFRDHSLLIGNESEKFKLYRWIDKYIIMEDVKLADITEEYSILEFLGPQAESFLTLFCGKCVDSLDYQSVNEIKMEEITTLAMKIKDESGLDRFWIITNPQHFHQLLMLLVDHNSLFQVGFIGEDSYNAYRIEKGIPVAPNELNDNFNPHEANLLGDVSFTKGCYIGQEVIARIDTYDKVQKELKKFIFDEDFTFNGNSIPIMNQKEEIGVVTSMAKSPNLNTVIGLGYIRKKYSEENINSSVRIGEKQIKLTIKDISG